jgi:glutathionyl-hydroquinone reductase
VGSFVDGKWVSESQWASGDGSFQRKPTTFRGTIGDENHPAESGRYHLYIALACPWAHRTLVVRALKRLESVISISVVEAFMDDDGWAFSDELPDHLLGKGRLRDVYLAADPHFTGRVTVPVLWDKQRGAIVNNESSEIIRMLTSAFDEFTDVDLDLYPHTLREEIDSVNSRVYPAVNNGVYKAGFATKQQPYEKAVTELFDCLDNLESRLEGRKWLIGGQLTEADIRLFTTLIRFDSVYHGHFKCNLRRLVDYPNLWAHTKRIYQLDGVANTVDFSSIKLHYYSSHLSVNPSGVVPLGPVLDLR